MAKGGSSAPDPDPNIGKAALMQAQTGEEWLGFAKDAFQVSSARQSDLDSLTKEVMQRQIGLAEGQQKYTQDVTNRSLDLAERQQTTAEGIAKQQQEQADYAFGLAQKDRERYEQRFQPAEDKYLDAVNAYDPTANQAERDALTKRLVDQQLGITENYGKAAAADRARYESDFVPIEQQIADDAKNYATPERQAEAAAQAKADVQTAGATQRAAAQRQMSSMGVNPASGRFQGVDRALDLGTALGSADAANKARAQVRNDGYQRQINAANLGRGLASQGMQEDQMAIGAGQAANATSAGAEQERQAAELRGIGLKADAANFGRGLPAQSAASSSLGLQGSSSAAQTGLAGASLGLGAYGNAIGSMGNAAQLGINAYGLGLGGAQAANAQQLASTDIMGTGFKGAMAGYGGMGQTLNQQYSNQIQAWSAQQQANAANAAGIGSALGGIFGLFMSDENLKEDKEALPEGAALDAVKEMPVEEWSYKPGVADEGRHVGTYAQDFQRATGKGDGRTIPAQDAIGITMAAVKDLDAKVDKLAKVVGLGARPAPKKKPVRQLEAA